MSIERRIFTQNYVEAVGKLISIRERKNGYRIATIFVKNEREAYLKIGIPENVEFNFKQRDSVKIQGFMRAYSYQTEKEEWRTTQYIVLESAETPEKPLQQRLGEEGHYYVKMYCQYDILGTIVNQKEDGKWTRMTIRTDEDRPGRKPSYVHVSMHNNKFFPKTKVGDIVAATCSIATPRKEINDKMIEFIDILINDIQVVKK